MDLKVLNRWKGSKCLWIAGIAVWFVSSGLWAQPTTLDEIYAPVVVATPPSDAFIGLSLLPDGELRHYNYGSHALQNYPMYLYSRDQGITWKSAALPAEFPYADQRSPISGEYVRVFCNSKGVYAMRTDGGLDGGRTIVKIDEKAGIMNKPPVWIRNGKRVISGAHRTDRSGAYVYYSDDDGCTWKASSQVTVPLHQQGGFHQGVRWNHGAVEPTVVELRDGRLWMLMRTSQDRHYQAFSDDGGETWSEATPSPFYGTITMPTLYRMADGRLLFFWCNTTPLPERSGTNGVWEDVFTNRDALHAAISEDDGRTWQGFRELLLNPERNSPVFGNTRVGEDKSVHQVQAVEVAPGKILVSAGQHRLCRRMLLFDVRWLYEPRRSCDFQNGLDDWSAFRYYKGIVGHCCYNRQAEALLGRHPQDSARRVLQMGYMPNDSLVQDNDGAVWNFPAAPDGSLTMHLRLPQKAALVTLVLNDRWFNPTDTVARYEGMYHVSLTRKILGIRDENWHDVQIFWHKNQPANVFVDGKQRVKLPVIGRTEHGVSYLHLLGEHTSGEKIQISFVEGGKILR